MKKIKVGDRVESKNTGAHGTVAKRMDTRYVLFEVNWDNGNVSHRDPRELKSLEPEPTFEKRRPEDAPPARMRGYSDEEWYDSDAYHNWERSPAGKRWMTPDNELTDTQEEEFMRDDLEKGLFHPGAANALKRE